MNFRSWQRWQLIEYALLQKISEEKAVENGKALPQTKSELQKSTLLQSMKQLVLKLHQIQHCLQFLR